MTKFATITSRLGAAFLLALTLSVVSGCDDKEKVLDVETPDGGVEVERDKDTGDVDVDVDDDN